MNLRSGVPLLLSCLCAVALVPVARAGWFYDDLQPSVPLVSASYEANRDVASSVPLLIAAIIAGWFCALIVEVSKARADTSAMQYSGFLLYQVVLSVEAVRAYAFDWWLYLLSRVNLVQLEPAMDLSEISGTRLPWVSGSIGIAMSLFLMFGSRHAQKVVE